MRIKVIMKKFTKLIATATAVILTLGFAGCVTDDSGNPVIPVDPTKYPGFINSAESGDDVAPSEKYVVNVRSEGGMKLDGVKVAAKRNGQVIKRGISKQGKIEFAVSLGEYELEIDETSLPAGYHLKDNVTYTTNATKREEINIELSSRLLNASASMTSYALGNIMRDFTFTDCGDGSKAGPSYTLSDLLETKKAVVLNFFYTTCNPCRAEFPYLQNAYNNWTTDDIEVLAICTTAMGDNSQSVANFRTQYNLTLPMGIDRLGICQAFGVSAYPTTVVIDRYGMIAFRTSGGEPTTGFWTGLFNKFTSPDYTQDLGNGGDENPNPTPAPGRDKPDVNMPSSAVLEQAALDEHVNAVFKPEDDEYSWPWLAGSDAEGSYIYSSNKGKGNSYAIVYADIEMREGEVLSFQYNVSTEANADYLHVFLDGDPMNTGYSGESNGWQTVNLYVADRDKTVSLSFAYVKDPLDPDTGAGDDVVKIRNISLADANQGGVVQSLDVMRSCASGEAENFQYEHYVDCELASDGFYHKVLYNEDGTKSDELGPIIYMTINQLSSWSDLHGSTLKDTDGTTYSTTLFSMTAQKYVETTKIEGSDETKFTVNIGGKDVTDAYTVYVLIMNYMPAPFYLIPVTEDLKGWAEAFVDDFEKGKAHENEWLEFCYYFDHYGAEHDDATNGDGGICKVDEDYTKGLTKHNAYEAYEKDDPELANSEMYNENTQRNKAVIDYPLQLVHNGTYYHFKAKQTGVYQIRSYTKGCSPSMSASSDNTDSYVVPVPKILIYNNKGDLMLLSSGALDHDAYKGVTYDGFSDYIALDADEEVYLYVCTTSGTKSYYDFEITYLGESFNKMLVCSTGDGIWTYYEDEVKGTPVWTYIGINVMYDDLTDCYYAVGADGKIDKDQPVYIDMLYSSFFMCNIKEYYMATLKFMIEDYAFEEHIHHGEDYQPIMEEALGKSTEGKQEGDKLYGLVPASREIVDILNLFIDQNVDGGKGEGNGWLAFAVYDAKLGK